MGHRNSPVWFLMEQNRAKKLEIRDGKLLQAGNDHKLVALPIASSRHTGGVHVSFPFCSELVHNHSDCSAEPPLRNGGAGAAIFTDQIEIVSGLFLFNRCISQQTGRCFASPRLVLSYDYKPGATILWRGTGLGRRRAALIPGCCIPCMPSVFTSPSVIWG